MTSTNSSSDTRSKKRALVLKRQRSRKPIFLVILALVTISAAGGLYFLLTPTGAHTPADSSLTGVRSDATQIAYPLSLFTDRQAHHFEHKTADGIAVRYFILQSADGILRAAFDACDVCWPENKGYRQEGDFMVCNNCGRRFESIRINEVQGGCNPAPLNRTIQNDQLVLLVKDIEQGQTYFNLSAAKNNQGRG